MSTERWLRLIAGTFVMLSVILGVLVSHWWLAFTTFVGLNQGWSSKEVQRR
ncbi:MAG TPA: hypothetical protein VFA07_19505 [Chthonomonadaceae bacterium]|nr:hypothetical protein [Chthonomonadaceae bacterium]